MENKINGFKKELLSQVSKVSSLNELNLLNSKFRIFVKACCRDLSNFPDNEKKFFGNFINNFKKEISLILESSYLKFGSKDEKSLKSNSVIIKKSTKIGHGHPLVNFCEIMKRILVQMGFSVVDGPEVELDEYNFEKLNMPVYHPARDMQDTFYVSSPDILLRSHTSSVQIRAMQSQDPPIRIISPGTVYRVDDIDSQHTPMFYQLEGLMVDKNVSFSNLKAVVIKLLESVFGGVDVRFRPSYYPYTEPSAAVDMVCTRNLNSEKKWMTVLGAGMVHPEVLKGVGYDPEKYTGFAFGLGLNRLAMLYYNLGEMKKFYENDISLWRQLN